MLGAAQIIVASIVGFLYMHHHRQLFKVKTGTVLSPCSTNKTLKNTMAFSSS